MEHTYPSNMSVTGSGSIASGAYNKVKIIGECEVLGALDCETFTCMGTCIVLGPVRAGYFKLQGEVTVNDDWSGGELKGMGQLTVGGHIRGRTISLMGQLAASQSVEAETISVKGAVELKGLLNAERLELRLYGPSYVKEIGGGRIDIRRSRWSTIKGWIAPQKHTELIVSTIEGDEIYLEHTRADVVRGNRIHLGAGCQIGRVEYTQSLHVARQAVVHSEIQL
ncbi:conserved hypothetical protein [Paenibacillus curdlanolyticus YK9]|uniref:Uncharacterized protein n=1 Tax=Paenibacillus curdlanolyticus YK9 TaxID=717606 RepID=E0IB82_9BACL|nr:hypothetical protein [Paenibacillus curdlanolyticus]EFM10373.1 conserved hypothetical protein [Paenibacillus curdlanolyticus YK9]